MGSDVNRGLGPHWLLSSAVDEAGLTWQWATRRNLIGVVPLGSDYLAVAAL